MARPEQGKGARAVRQLVESYGAGRFRVNGQVHEGSVLILPERTLAWPVAHMDDVALGALTAVTEAQPPVDLLLLGCGARIRPVAAGMREGLRAVGIGLELMDTGAAARTFNLLVAEDRRVAAALIALPAGGSTKGR